MKVSVAVTEKKISSICWFIPQEAELPGLGQYKFRGQELPPDLPHTW